MATELDDVDIELLALLQVDADRTNVELAREVGLSPAATLHRIRRLKESGVVRQVIARLDPSLVGLPLQVYVSVTMVRNDPVATRGFIETCRELPQVISADWVAGETDAMLLIVARDVAELQVVLTRLATRGGQRLTTLLRLEEIKPPSPLPLSPSHLSRSRLSGRGGPDRTRDR
ncbi:MAG: Lrp/AsnC family transcriptional regulator, leucine-responsive regulatory protein [Actinomycetota bacterium]|nr:Lrp/AsnC family transcriptional regulator, leucine-responsive regulatory protein [Actinomycetota bacterium]